jgi:sec-independent protein translocase protein TatA
MEMVVILVIALLVLGPARLPEAARSLGRGFRELRDSLQSDHDDEEESKPARAVESPYSQASPPSPGYAASGPYDDDLPTDDLSTDDPPTEPAGEDPPTDDPPAEPAGEDLPAIEHPDDQNGGLTEENQPPER